MNKYLKLFWPKMWIPKLSAETSKVQYVFLEIHISFDYFRAAELPKCLRKANRITIGENLTYICCCFLCIKYFRFNINPHRFCALDTFVDLGNALVAFIIFQGNIWISFTNSTKFLLNWTICTYNLCIAKVSAKCKPFFEWKISCQIVYTCTNVLARNIPFKIIYSAPTTLDGNYEIFMLIRKTKCYIFTWSWQDYFFVDFAPTIKGWKALTFLPWKYVCMYEIPIKSLPLQIQICK